MNETVEVCLTERETRANEDFGWVYFVERYRRVCRIR